MEKMITRSDEETKKLAHDFARLNLVEGSTLTRVIALYGELGAGKTTFVQGLAVSLGIKQRIISPTFIIVKLYDLSFARGPLARLTGFYHIDLYRVENEKQLEGLGVEEILEDKNAIVAIEWAEKLGKLLPKRRFDIYFKHISESQREITIQELI